MFIFGLFYMKLHIHTCMHTFYTCMWGGLITYTQCGHLVIAGFETDLNICEMITLCG